MKNRAIVLNGVAALAASVGLGAGAATTVQIGSSGLTFASTAVQCAVNPAAGVLGPMVQAGLFNPKRNASAVVSLNGSLVTTVTATEPTTTLWLPEGDNAVVLTLSRKSADRYAFTVTHGQCSSSGNWFSADGTLEYAASGKSYATVTPGCAWNALSGRPQPYVHLFDNGTYLLNVSVNGVPLTQLSSLKTHTPVFLSAGQNVISAANASLSTDYYVRDGGDGSCLLAQ